MPLFKTLVVEQIPAAVADPALGNTVLPWTTKTGLFRLNVKAFYASLIYAFKLEPRS